MTRRLFAPLVALVALAVLFAPRPAAMTGEGIVVGSFVINSTTGDQSVTGLGGQPKAIVFFHSGQNTTDAVTDTGMSSLSWTDCTGDSLSGTRNNDGGLSNTGAVYSLSDNDLIRFVSNTPAVTVEANFVSCDSDGFTINVGTTDATQFRIGFIAFKGSGIQAKAASFTKPNATGSQSTSGVGFSPTLVLFMCGRSDLVSADSTGGTTTNQSLNITNGSQQWGLSYGATSNSAGGQLRTDNVMVCSDGSSQDDIGSTTSLDSDGWTINWTSIDSTQEEPVFYLALRGVSSKLGTDNQRTSNGTTAISGFGFTPQAVLVAGRSLVSGTTWTAQGRFIVGAGDGSNEVGQFTGANHGCGTNCATARAFFTNDLIRMYTPAQTGSSSTLLSAADLQSLDSDGYTINWTTTDATAREYVYAGFAVPAAAGGGGTKQPAPLLFCCRPR